MKNGRPYPGLRRRRLTLDKAKELAERFSIGMLTLCAFADLHQKEKIGLLMGVETYVELVDRLNTLDTTALVEEFRCSC